MTQHRESVMEVAGRVRSALESQDLSAFRDLLDPDVHWGAPGARKPTCQNREQVLAWYQRANDAGVRGQVFDVEAVGDRILVGLTVSRTPGATERGGVALRWQVLTVRRGLVVDIVGFDDRNDAVAAAQEPVAAP